jgi:hypothetical protein
MQTLTIASQNAVGARDIGVATSSSTFFRQIGGTLGTAIIFSVLFARIPETIAAAFGRSEVQQGIAEAIADPAVLADPANKQILELLRDAQGGGSVGDALNGDSSFLSGSDPRLAAPFLEGFANATITVFWVSLAVILVAFLLSFFLRAPALRDKSALQENVETALEAQRAADESAPMVQPAMANSAKTDSRE